MVGSGPLAAIPRKVGCDEESSASKPSLNVISSELLASVKSCLGAADIVDVRVDELSACDEEFSDARAGEEEESFANQPAIMSRSSGVLELLLWVDVAVGDSGRCPIWIGVVVNGAKVDGSVWEGTISRSEDGRLFGAFFLAIRRAGKRGEFLNVLTRLRISEQTCKEVLMNERLMMVGFRESYYPICLSCFFYSLEKEAELWKGVSKQSQIKKGLTGTFTWPKCKRNF